MNKLNICIFDIDGCILPSVFPSLEDYKESDYDKIVKEVNEKGQNKKLYPEFLKFYKENSKQINYPHFITGRQKKPFKILTDKQLKPLWEIKPYWIYYYPENLPHLPIAYFKFKLKTIMKIFYLFLLREELYKDTVINFHIFDDLTDYYPTLMNLTELLNIDCKLWIMKNPEKWNEIKL